ncbi:hypothetical protein FKM82_010710 [Ascaphus truei]
MAARPQTRYSLRQSAGVQLSSVDFEVQRRAVKKDNHPIHATRMKKQKIKRLKEKTRSKFSDSQTCEGVAKCDSPEKSSTAVIVNKEPSPMSKQRRPRQITSDDDDDDDEDCCTEAHSSVVKDVQGLSIEKQARKRKVPEDMATQDSDRHQIPQKLKKSIRKKGKKDNKPIRATRMKKQKLKHLRKKTRSKFSDSQTCEGVAKCDSPKKSTTTVIIHEEPSPSKQTRLWQIAYDDDDDDDDDDDEDCCTEPQSSVIKDVQGLSLEKQARERKVLEDMATQDFEMQQIQQKLKKSICIKDSPRTKRSIPSGEPEKERSIRQRYEPEDIASDEDSSSSEVTSYTGFKVPHGAGVHGNKSSVCFQRGSGPTVSRASQFTCPDLRPIVFGMYTSSGTDEEETRNWDKDIRQNKIAEIPYVENKNILPAKPTFVGQTERTEVLVECIKTAENCTFHGSRESICICKSFDLSTFSTGKWTIGPSQETKYRFNGLDTIVFYILRGSVMVTVHVTSYHLKTGDYFFVPPGNKYGIKNILSEEAILHFTQIKGRPSEDSF